MSLLKKPNLHTRWKKSLLIVVSLLLLVPCAAAAAFAMRFDVETQEPQEKTLTQKDKEKLELMQRRKEADTTWRIERDPQVREEMERKERVEMEMREVRQAALIRLAKVNMDQAIQIATSQQPGKVMVCTLEAKGWEKPGQLAKDGIVFYHVMIANEGEAGATHIWVNAIDGSIINTEKELPRKQREP